MCIRDRKTFFNNKFGVDATSGLSFPDTRKIANAYGIRYICANVNDELDSAVAEFITSAECIILEVFCCLQVRYPRVSSSKNPDGTFTSRPFEDMEPFLSDEEFRSEMIVQPLRR